MRVPLLGGTYLARSIIANAQRCVNLYPEKNPQDAEAPVTHYPTPGLHLHVIPLVKGVGRCLYTATNGRLYYVCGTTVYYIDSLYNQVALGVMLDNLTTNCYMVDNGNVIVLVDGTTHGYAIDLVTNAFAQIIDPNFLGADRVDYVDTFLVLNQPGTRNFYSSLSNITFDSLTLNPGRPLAGNIAAGSAGGTPGTYTAQPLTGGTGNGATATIVVGSGGGVSSVTLDNDGIGYVAGDVLSATIAGPLTGFAYTLTSVAAAAFDPTYVAAKTGFPDEIATLCCVHREIWLFGIVKTTEVWYDAGGATFPFAIMPGMFIEHGCAAKYSVCKHDLLVFWLSIDAEGQGTVFMGGGYVARKISTPAIAAQIATYDVISDAIGMMYKQADHVFYILTFPSADKTWVYDLTEGLWHERTWTDPDTGEEHRWRGNCTALAYGDVLTADWENGNVYHLHLDLYNDFEGPIVRRRGFPHLTKELKRTTYDCFIADMQCGQGSVPNAEEGTPGAPTVPQIVNLRWSDNRGQTFGNPVQQSIGAQGEYLVTPQWRQLGMARDRVFELFWSADAYTALNGAYVDVTPTVDPGT
jgi:hypothetical protein